MDYLDRNGKPAGIGVDFIEALNKRLGGRLQPIPGSWNEIYTAVKERRLPALMDITPRPDREADFNFTSPYIRIPHLIFTQQNAPPIGSLADLSGKTIGVEAGFFIIDLLQKKYPEIRVKTYPDTSSALAALARREVDAYIGNQVVTEYIIRNEQLRGIRAAGRVDETRSVNAIGVRKDWPILRDILQQALDDITQEERDTILARTRIADAGRRSSDAFLRRLPAQDRKWLREHKRIRVAVMDDWPPFNFLDESGKPSGIGADYLEALNERLGRVLIPVPGNWRRLYDDVAKKRLDVIMDITPKSSREPLFHFTSPYFETSHVIIARKDTPFIASERDLVGRTLALERGFGNVEYFRNNHPEVRVELYENTRAALTAVSRGDADAYAGNRAVALYHLEKLLLTNLRIHGDLNKPGSKLAFGIRKDWPQLRDILQRALDDITPAERNRIMVKWIRNTTAEAPLLKLTPTQRQWLDRHPEIPIGVDGAWPPIDFMDRQGRFSGITADYLRLLEERLGVHFLPQKSASFKAMLEKVMRGELKVGATVAHTPERARKLLYSDPFFTVREVIVTRDSQRELRRPEDLVGHTVAMEEGYVTVNKIREKYPDIRLLLVKDTLTALQKVSWG